MSIEAIAVTLLLIVFVAIVDGLRSARRPPLKARIKSHNFYRDLYLDADDPGPLGQQTIYR